MYFNLLLGSKEVRVPALNSYLVRSYELKVPVSLREIFGRLRATCDLSSYLVRDSNNLLGVKNWDEKS